MKHFYYSIESVKTPSRNSWTGTKVTVNVYQCKKNIMNYIGQATWNTAGYKGETSEVYDLLLEKKLVSKKQYDLAGGYYSHIKNGNFKISKI